MREFQHVGSNRKGRAERAFPPEADPLKFVYMKALRRVGECNPVASRVHFHYDASVTGKVNFGHSCLFPANTRPWFPSGHGMRRLCPSRAPLAH